VLHLTEQGQINGQPRKFKRGFVRGRRKEKRKEIIGRGMNPERKK